MNRQKWIMSTLSLLLLYLVTVGIINYTVDPFNIFKHKNFLNSYQIGFHERIQKTAYLKYNSSLDFDSILFGSSRATYYNQKSFKNMNLYNYSFSGAMPEEYSRYLEFAKSINSNKFKTIVLALDFYTYRKKIDIEKYNNIEESKILFFLKKYFTFDTLKFSIVNIKRSITNKTSHRSYDRNNIVHSDKVDENKVMLLAKNRSKKYYDKFKVDNNYRKILAKLKDNNSNSKFIVFVPPLSKPFLDKIYSNKVLTNHYIDWLQIIISVFDKAYLAAYPASDLSTHYYKYSLDGDHFYPDTCDEIIDIINNSKDSKNIKLINSSFLSNIKFNGDNLK